MPRTCRTVLPLLPLLPLLLLLLAAACQQTGEPASVEAPADSAAGDVAFELAGPGESALMVPVYINGEGPFDFILDTGATLTCLDRELADRLQLPEARGVTGVGAGVGGSGQMELVTIDSIRIGNSRASGMMGCSIELQHTGSIGLEIDGLLGLNFLREFRVLLDFERNVLNLQAADAP